MLIVFFPSLCRRCFILIRVSLLFCCEFAVISSFVRRYFVVPLSLCRCYFVVISSRVRLLFVNSTSHNPEHGSPARRLHHTERAEFVQLKKVHTLKTNYPKGDYTRSKAFGKGLYLSTQQSKHSEHRFSKGRLN